MSFKTSDREQLGIIGYSLSDFVEKDSKARFIANIIEEMNLEVIIRDYSDQGGEANDPRIMLATWFLGYSESITSSRKIENSCKKNLDFIYISGNLRPDHTTLSRFRKRHIKELGKYFIEIIKIAQSKGLSEFKEIAIDGTKIPSVSSKKRSMREDRLDRYIKAVEKDIENYMQEADKEESSEELDQLLRSKSKLEEAKEKLEARKEKIKKECRSSHQINVEEPEACMMETYGNKSFPGYNAQVGADTKTQIIVSAEVVQDRNDRKQFSQQHKQLEENLGSSNQRKYITDGGYQSMEQLEYIEKNKIDAYMGQVDNESTRINEKDFIYDNEKDKYICPEGKELNLYKTEDNKSFKGKIYKKKDCHDCKLKDKCLSEKNKTGSRVLRRDHREVYAEEMKKKMQTEEASEILFRRKTTVEPAIGNIKSNMGNNRFRLKGLENVNGEFYLMCIGHNINKLYKMLVFFVFLTIIKNNQHREVKY